MRSEEVEDMRKRVFGLHQPDKSQSRLRKMRSVTTQGTLSILFVFLSPSKCHLNLSRSG